MAREHNCRIDRTKCSGAVIGEETERMPQAELGLAVYYGK